jgi:uncharacterized membrane protein YkoI
MPRCFPAVAILALAMLPPATPADQDEALRLERSGEILSLETVLARARSQQPGNVLDVDLEHEHGRYVYEVIVLDHLGRVWALDIDAATGALLKPAREGN